MKTVRAGLHDPGRDLQSFVLGNGNLKKELPCFRTDEKTSYHHWAKLTAVPYSAASLESPCPIICSAGVLGRLKPIAGPQMYIDCFVGMEMEEKEQGGTCLP